MKKLLVIVLVLGIAAAIAYLLGPDTGRARRDALLARARKADEVEIDLTDPSTAADLAATVSAS